LDLSPRGFGRRASQGLNPRTVAVGAANRAGRAGRDGVPLDRRCADAADPGCAGPRRCGLRLAAGERCCPRLGDHQCRSRREPAGDFNNDGFADLAVGTTGEDVGTVSGAGAVNVLYGSAGGLTGVGSGVEPDDFFGFALADSGPQNAKSDRGGSQRNRSARLQVSASPPLR
jgi:FG-GAP repeat